MGISTGQDRRIVAVVVTRDGRRASLPLENLEPTTVAVSLRSILISLLGLIGGSRRESGGRRTER
jgi:hypothetical protein